MQQICLLTSFVQIWHSLRVTYQRFIAPCGRINRVGQQKNLLPMYIKYTEAKGWFRGSTLLGENPHLNSGTFIP